MNAHPESRDLYDVLGVSRDVAPADLKKAYREIAKKYHPDHHPGDKAAEEKFKQAANAYQVLSDADKRAAYDRYGPDGLRGGGGGGGGNAPGPGGFGGFDNVEDIFSAFGDLFGDFFAGRRGRPARGADQRLELNLTFREAVSGAKKDVKITRSVGCAACNATGNARGAKAEVCHPCQGRGQVVHAQGFFMVQTTCAPCRGSGKLIKDPCADCRGRGLKSETSTLSLVIPPGIDNGQTLRVAGKGESTQGGTSGDLYVVLNVDDDARFDRDGFDVTSVVTVSFAQAALGGEVEIDTLDDGCTGTAVLELAPGTQPGDIVVRRGQGIPHHDRSSRGDHFIEFRIEVPKKLTSQQEKLLREFAAELGEESKRPASPGKKKGVYRVGKS
jgi:molecular chaperone DnaJ